MTYTYPDFRTTEETNKINKLAKSNIAEQILNVNRELSRFLIVGAGQARYTHLLLSARKDGTIRTLQPTRIARENVEDSPTAKSLESFKKTRKARKSSESLNIEADAILADNLNDNEVLELLDLL